MASHKTFSRVLRDENDLTFFLQHQHLRDDVRSGPFGPFTKRHPDSLVLSDPQPSLTDSIVSRATLLQQKNGNCWRLCYAKARPAPANLTWSTGQYGGSEPTNQGRPPCRGCAVLPAFLVTNCSLYANLVARQAPENGVFDGHVIFRARCHWAPPVP
jgi:hypothetical protein